GPLRLGLGDHVLGPINIGSREGTTILELADHILRLSNSSSTLQVLPSREIEVSRYVANTARAARLGLALEKPSLGDLGRLIGARPAAASACSQSSQNPRALRTMSKGAPSSYP